MLASVLKIEKSRTLVAIMIWKLGLWLEFPACTKPSGGALLWCNSFQCTISQDL
jgi:hypothetical protein